MNSRLTGVLAVLLLASPPMVCAKTLRIGDQAPDFRSVTLDGGTFSLVESIRGHDAVVVMFLSTVCPYSNLHSDRIRDLSRDLASRSVLFVGVNSNRTETSEEVASLARAKGYVFPFIKDGGCRIADAFGAKLTPEVFVFDRTGRLRYHGRIESKYRSPDLRNALEAILDGKPIREPEARAFGCAITREVERPGDH